MLLMRQLIGSILFPSPIHSILIISNHYIRYAYQGRRVGRMYVLVGSMTIRETINLIKNECSKLSVRYSSEFKEYRITTKSGTNDERESRTYYTNNSDDAIKTARYMQTHYQAN